MMEKPKFVINEIGEDLPIMFKVAVFLGPALIGLFTIIYLAVR